MGLTHLHVLLIFNRAVAGKRRFVVGKFDDHVTRTALAFRVREPPVARQIAPSCASRKFSGR